VLFITIIFFILFTKPAFAASPIVTIFEPLPTDIIAGDEFSITFNVNTININTSYHYKIVGDGNADISTQPNTSCGSNYENCETLTIGAEKIATATAKARLNTSTGTDNIKIRIAQADKHSSTFDSSFVTILSLLPTPTPTLRPTNPPTPTNTPIPTTIKSIPTLRPTINNLPSKQATPSATTSETPTLSPEPTIEPTTEPTVTPQILGVATKSASKSNPKSLIPSLLIGAGGILLLTPLILAKIKHVKKSTKKDL